MDNNTYSLIMKTNTVLLIVIGLLLLSKQESMMDNIYRCRHENKNLKKELAKMEKQLYQAKNSLK